MTLLEQVEEMEFSDAEAELFARLTMAGPAGPMALVCLSAAAHLLAQDAATEMDVISRVAEFFDLIDAVQAETQRRYPPGLRVVGGTAVAGQPSVAITNKDF